MVWWFRVYWADGHSNDWRIDAANQYFALTRLILEVGEVMGDLCNNIIEIKCAGTDETTLRLLPYGEKDAIKYPEHEVKEDVPSDIS